MIDSQFLKANKLSEYGIEKRYRDVTFESIEKKGIPKHLLENFKIVKSFADNLSANIEKGHGLIMAGNPGTLKTTFAIAILRKWIDENNNGFLVNMCSLIDNLFTLRERNKEEWAKYEHRIRNVPLLVLDDLGSENIEQNWILSKVDSIISERYSKMKSIIITTNFSFDELSGTYSGRIIDRLADTSEFLYFNGDSLRTQQNKIIKKGEKDNGFNRDTAS